MSSGKQPSSNAQSNALMAGGDQRDQVVIRVAVQIPEIDSAIVREVAAILRGEPSKAQQFRAQLRAIVTASRRDTRVFDILAPRRGEWNWGELLVTFAERRSGGWVGRESGAGTGSWRDGAV
ncbi:hypothetical protein, partial [Vineibacter terrae]|uniref:hypothetical protein n=1 Tax=Vineibacter terrae TaxID=2586908 RepID=UPI001C49865E